MLLWLVGFKVSPSNSSPSYYLSAKSSFNWYIKPQTAIFSNKSRFYAMRKQRSIHFPSPYLHKEQIRYCLPYEHLLQKYVQYILNQWYYCYLPSGLCTDLFYHNLLNVKHSFSVCILLILLNLCFLLEAVYWHQPFNSFTFSDHSECVCLFF